MSIRKNWPLALSVGPAVIIDDEKLELARQLGADYILNTRGKSIPEEVKKIVPDGVDFAQWSDEELEAEKQRLLLLLQEKTATKAAEKKAVKKSAVKKAAVTKVVGTEEAATVKKPRPKPRKRVVRKAKTEN